MTNEAQRQMSDDKYKNINDRRLGKSELSENLQKAESKNYSIEPCKQCGKNYQVKDIREFRKHPYCDTCSLGIAWAKKRYTNWSEGKLKQVNLDKITGTVSHGPYFKNKS